jgi:hypothetical protein
MDRIARPDEEHRQSFFAALDDAYAALWADPKARDEEFAERALFESTLADDLDEG